ncbi:hypothetical protein QL285_014789 [Trifolium repens]|nr:hypothetical protein QL285_014789 [Trifolium repens]
MNPRVIKGTRYESLDEFEKECVAYIETLCIMNVGDLLKAEGYIEQLVEYMERMRYVSQERRMEFLLRSRAKKEKDAALAASGEVVAVVDPLSQLIVADNDAAKGRNKRKNEGQISVAIPGKSLEVGGSSKGELPISKKLRSSSSRAASNVEVVPLQEEDPENTPSPRPAAAIDIIPPPPPVPANNVVPSPWDPLLNPEVFIEKAMDMSGGGDHFDSTSTEELARLSMGYELKGILLNHALASRQKLAVSAAEENMKVIRRELDIMEEKVKATQEKFVADMEVAKAESKKALDDLEEKLKDDHAAEVKALKKASAGKDAYIKELSEDRDVLQKEKARWAEEKMSLEESIGAHFDEGFNFAVEQVKVLFPDIDAKRLGEASALMVIKDGQLVPYVPPSDSTP